MLHAIVPTIDDGEKWVLMGVLVNRLVAGIVKSNVVGVFDNKVSSKTRDSRMSDLHIVERLTLLQAPEDLCCNVLMISISGILDALDDVGIILKLLVDEPSDIRR